MQGGSKVERPKELQNSVITETWQLLKQKSF